MSNLPKTVDEVLDFAIEQEENAAAFYEELAAQAASTDMKQGFVRLAREEQKHRSMLQSVKDLKRFTNADYAISDLKIGTELPSFRNVQEIGYEDAMILAMEREKEAFKLYMQLAELAEDGQARKLLRTLAAEEAKHKLIVELAMDQDLDPEDDELVEPS